MRNEKEKRNEEKREQELSGALDVSDLVCFRSRESRLKAS